MTQRLIRIIWKFKVDPNQLNPIETLLSVLFKTCGHHLGRDCLN